MRLVQLKPTYFRAFGDTPAIRFDENLTIFYGGNGTGKSSLAESLEWLFFGFTKRRRKGDQYSKLEYKGSYIYKGCPTGVTPNVEAEIIFRDGSTHIVKRSMGKDGKGKLTDIESVIEIDGEEIKDFYSIGIVTEACCPIVVQHGIQDFIHTRPIDRYRIISEALGLADLTKFKDVFEQAKNRYRSDPPPSVEEAKRSLRRSIDALTRLSLTEIAAHWRDGEVDDRVDYQAIFARARELTGSIADNPVDLLKDIRYRQSVEMSKLFNITPYQPNQNLDTILDEFGHQLEEVSTEQEAVLHVAGELAQVITSKYAELEIEFLRKGLELIEQKANLHSQDDARFECPFCGEMTLTHPHVLEIQKNTSGVQTLTEKQTKLNDSLFRFERELSKLDEWWSKLEFSAIPEEQIQTLRKMFEREEARLDDFVKLNRHCSEIIAELKTQISTYRKLANNLHQKPQKPEDVLQKVESLTNAVQNINGMFVDVIPFLHEYSLNFAAFLPILQRELSDEKTVAIYTGLVELMMTRPHAELVRLNREFDADILRCQQIADDYILDQQRRIVSSREKDILEWYELLSPNPDVKFSGLEPGKSEYNLKASAFGQELNAAASLSQSQLNCLGLSVYIPSIVASESPFDFIVFDDPVQSMDDEHHEAFLIKVLPKLLGSLKRQVIVLTHLKPTADRIRYTNYDLSPLYYKFDKLSSTGPQLSDYKVLRDEIHYIRDLSEGDEMSRCLAVDRLRVLCELIMREKYAKEHGVPLPPEYKNPRQIMQAFRRIIGVSANHAHLIEDTIDWSDKAHHTDPDWQLPDAVAIKLHVDRLESIINAIGLPKV